MVRIMIARPALALALLLASCTSAQSAATAQPVPQPSEWGALIERLSEPGGYFQSDNLVSNETSYLHVLGRMRQMDVKGGAYVGVGPDQNFSYIAAVRPEVAYIIDIRRDNLLHHLLFKGLFENARNRMEFLSLLVGVPPPADLDAWNEMSIDSIVFHVDGLRSDSAQFESAQQRIRTSAARWGYPLSEADLAQMRAIHSAFAQWGLGLRYSNRGSYPTWRQLLLQTDLEGRKGNYLASEESFRFVRDLQRRNLIIPVVGDLAGAHALGAIGRDIAARGLRVSAFYVSNVEQYLLPGAGPGAGFYRFAETVTALPFADNSVIIRSYFGRGGYHPMNEAGHASTQLLETFVTFVAEQRAGGYPTYDVLVRKNVLPLREKEGG
jgi:hypothetical protein